jgi:hypothetical protein
LAHKLNTHKIPNRFTQNKTRPGDRSFHKNPTGFS